MSSGCSCEYRQHFVMPKNGLQKNTTKSHFLESINFTLFGERVLTEVSKIRILRRKDHPELSVSNSNKKCPYKRHVEQKAV
jgi:hypothetical protein